MSRGNHPMHFASTFPLRPRLLKTHPSLSDLTDVGGIKVGHDVWIGKRAIILPNVSIGSGAIVGAGSVVTKDVPPYAVAAGNPARIIRYRFSTDQIEQLLSIQWWDWTDQKIIDEQASFFSPIDDFIQRHLDTDPTT